MNTIAITGATGQLGRLVLAGLKTKLQTHRIIALARSADKAADLGVPVREADYDRPETLQRSLAGVDTLLLISSSEIGRRSAQHRNVIAAAKQSGVERIVYTSLLHADTSPLSLAAEHLDTERALKDSGIRHTILRNGWYTENYMGSVKAALAGGVYIGSAGEGKIASATRSDYADAAVHVLATEGHDGKTYELAGDEAYTLTDLAAEIARQSGSPVAYHNLPEADYAAALISVGLPAAFAQAIASWNVEASRGALLDDSGQLSKLIGRATTPLSAAVAEALD